MWLRLLFKLIFWGERSSSTSDISAEGVQPSGLCETVGCIKYGGESFFTATFHKKPLNRKVQGFFVCVKSGLAGSPANTDQAGGRGGRDIFRN